MVDVVLAFIAGGLIGAFVVVALALMLADD